MCAFYSLHGGRRSAMGPPFRGIFFQEMAMLHGA